LYRVAYGLFRKGPQCVIHSANGISLPPEVDPLDIPRIAPLAVAGMIEATPVQDDGELEEILALQRENLARNLTAEQIAAEGFVTVEHSLEILKSMHAVAPSVIARDGAALAGYALVMPVECRAFVPVLAPMFRRLESLGVFRERFYVMGQICVARAWRGQGIFDLLYRAHRQHLKSLYDCSVTEVATRNVRSMRAHARVGFAVIDRYRDATDEWALLRWDW
jgi:GNAT superfamily N-acetyltransferase